MASLRLSWITVHSSIDRPLLLCDHSNGSTDSLYSIDLSSRRREEHTFIFSFIRTFINTLNACSVIIMYNLWPFRWLESFIECVLMRCLTSCSLPSSLIHSSWDSLVSNQITHLSILIYRIPAPLAIMALCYIFLVRHVRAKFRKRTNKGEGSMK